MPANTTAKDSLQPIEDETQPTLPPEGITKDLLPFEDISKNQLEETPIKAPKRLLKSKKGKLVLNKDITAMSHKAIIKMLNNRSKTTYKVQESY
ncbi:ATP-dependent DNA helicase sgs1 [Puccinia graminis f. sp. tritici]|uniref:ATP-dependent DNA helicase sgs1 n=1 Tax=Puccinia graminis f. sp. tritici TaxID=56615 RepID=A0A5B0M1H4_PUCGR|nr:ATP-dependent DNA helicase sgs1 [Puccinia graminis f. sp. tritici]